MKNFKNYLSLLAMAALLFTSCSKEDQNVIDPDGEKATLSFATVLNDMMANKAALKDHLSNIPECSDAVPDHVAIVLTGPENVGSMDEPYIVNVSPNPGDYDGDGEMEYFTMYDSELELPPGEYQLTYFVVYDEMGNKLWVAPMEESGLDNFVDDPLPVTINLEAGVKLYVDVEVLCFDDRMVNEYGYLFIDIETNRAIEFCLFGNYCDENGRHFVAEYSVSVWVGDSADGDVLYTDVQNNVDFNEETGQYAEDPLCFVLPDTDGEDEYYFEITLMDSDNYGDVENRVVLQGSINDDMVKSFFAGENNLEYYHFFTGECDIEDDIPLFTDPLDDADNYKTCLYEINDSGVFGFVGLRLEGNKLEATVVAIGLEPNEMHPQHIHGEEGLNSTCDNYGPVLVPLTLDDGTFPIANNNGMIIYSQNITLGQDGNPTVEMLRPIVDRTVNLHGMTVGGEYMAGMVVACGALEAVD